MTLKNGSTITSNDFWGGLNRRFDKRTSRLFNMGYRIEGSDYGSFMVRRDYNGIRVVPISIILHMPNHDYVRFLHGTLAPSGARKLSKVA